MVRHAPRCSNLVSSTSTPVLMSGRFTLFLEQALSDEKLLQGRIPCTHPVAVYISG